MYVVFMGRSKKQRKIWREKSKKKKTFWGSRHSVLGGRIVNGSSRNVMRWRDWIS